MIRPLRKIQSGGLALIGVSIEDAESYPAVNGKFSLIYSWDPLESAPPHRAGFGNMTGRSFAPQAEVVCST